MKAPSQALRTAVDWAVLPAPSPRLLVTAIVPVRNEQDNLPQTLAALEAQRTTDGCPLDKATYEVLVLANNCTDRSADVVRTFARAHPDFRVHVVETEFHGEHAHIGNARRQLMDEACRRLMNTAGEAGVIASTDGDTCVAPTWIAETLAEIGRGADCVGGRIDTLASHSMPAPLLRMKRLDTAHQLLASRLESLIDPDPADPWPRHHQHFGASLAVTTRAYRLVGGLPAKRYLEDQALVDALRRADLRIRHSSRVRVSTSDRLEGRVEVGLSWQLRVWSDMQRDARPLLVAPVARSLQTLVLRRKLRECWSEHRGLSKRPSCARLADDLGVDGGWLAKQVGACDTFGSLWEAVQAARAEVSASRRSRRVRMTQAIDTMRREVRRC
ncbi:MAG: hypothetical protein JWQ11_2629 [Rhizobacter sp.]|nr:hypothetical protein [Rhizobacter sp.]